MKTYCKCCGNTYPNDDELAFHFWAVEAKEHGIIKEWRHQFPTFDLSGKMPFLKYSKKTGKVRKTYLGKHTYTPDFSISDPSDALYGMLPELRPEIWQEGTHYFDVKPKFEKYHSRTEAFRNNQKWLKSKHGVFVHPVVPKDFFHRTWIPEKLAFCLNGKRRKPFAKCKLVGDI